MAYISFQPSDYFNTKLYTGTGATNAQTSVGFQPDWVWIQNRGGTYANVVFDAVRGATKKLEPQGTGAEATVSDTLTSFDSDGFTLGADSSSYCNRSSSPNTYVAWNWKANGSGSANTDGSISSTVSANDTAGFSIVKYTGTGSAGNVGHGLSTAPKVLINKALGTQDWFFGHSSLGFTKFLKLNETNASSTNSGIWNDTAPTSSVFTINSANGNTNSTGVEYITYCFAEKKGFSKFGSYIGNGSTDGTFVYLGFRPAFIMLKYSAPSGGVGSWHMYDNKRKGYNTENDYVQANTTSSENSDTDQVDLLSNGFKCRATGSDSNESGSTYVYMAFAEAPLVSSNDIPAVAR